MYVCMYVTRCAEKTLSYVKRYLFYRWMTLCKVRLDWKLCFTAKTSHIAHSTLHTITNKMNFKIFVFVEVTESIPQIILRKAAEFPVLDSIKILGFPVTWNWLSWERTNFLKVMVYDDQNVTRLVKHSKGI